jgi:hypothetical protein
MEMKFYADDQEKEVIEVAELILEEYFGLGTTGADAIVDCLRDLVGGQMNVSEWETDDDTVFRAVAMIGMKLQEENKLHQMIVPLPVV